MNRFTWAYSSLQPVTKGTCIAYLVMSRMYFLAIEIFCNEGFCIWKLDCLKGLCIAEVSVVQQNFWEKCITLHSTAVFGNEILE